VCQPYAARVMSMVIDQDLPLTISKYTETGGNSFFHAVSDLLQEHHISQGLPDKVLSAGSNHYQLRHSVLDFLERLDEEGNHSVFNAAKTKVIQVQGRWFTQLFYLEFSYSFRKLVRVTFLHFSLLTLLLGKKMSRSTQSSIPPR